MNYPESTLQYRVYEDSTDLLGIAKVKLPDLKVMTQDVSGAGIAGKVEAVLMGQLEAMTLELDFSSQTDKALQLAEMRRHNIDLRIANQVEDPVAGTIGVQAEKHVFVVVPKSLSGATIETAGTSTSSGQYAVRYWAAYKDNKKIIEIDPFNGICIINGVDHMAAVRAALGM